MKTEIEKLIEENATLRERSRILNELTEIELPLGVWPRLRPILCPEN